MVKNTKSDGPYYAITSQSGRSTISPLLPTIVMLKTDSSIVDEALIIESDKAIDFHVSVDEDNGKGKVDEPVVKQIPQPPPPFLKD